MGYKNSFNNRIVCSSVHLYSSKHQPLKMNNLIIQADENKKRTQPSGGEWVEGLEEEDKLEILRILLESWTNGRDGDEFHNIQDKGKDDYRDDEAPSFFLLRAGSFLQIVIMSSD